VEWKVRVIAGDEHLRRGQERVEVDVKRRSALETLAMMFGAVTPDTRSVEALGYEGKDRSLSISLEGSFVCQKKK
jgi:hypothetical protein